MAFTWTYPPKRQRSRRVFSTASIRSQVASGLPATAELKNSPSM